jgi:hypothetical protein
MGDMVLHLLTANAFQMAAGHDARGQERRESLPSNMICFPSSSIGVSAPAVETNRPNTTPKTIVPQKVRLDMGDLLWLKNG